MTGIFEQKYSGAVILIGTHLKLDILNAAVVILAESHNPSILHPSFLAAQQIVPPDWQVGEPPVSTPAFSIVKYTNHVTFLAEQSKLQVLDEAPKPDTPIPGIVIKYLETLPHVRYTAVGVNFTGLVRCSNADAFLKERFLKSGPWVDAAAGLKAVGYNFLYHAEGARLRLHCDAGAVRQPPENAEVQGVVVKANYHTLVPTEKLLDACKDAVSQFASRLVHFKGIAQIVLGLEN